VHYRTRSMAYILRKGYIFHRIRHISGIFTLQSSKLDPCSRRQKCSPKNLYFSAMYDDLWLYSSIKRLTEKHCVKVRYPALVSKKITLLYLSSCCRQGRIIQCAGCTVGGAPAARGRSRRSAAIFYHAVLTFERSVYA